MVPRTTMTYHLVPFLETPRNLDPRSLRVYNRNDLCLPWISTVSSSAIASSWARKRSLDYAICSSYAVILRSWPHKGGWLFWITILVAGMVSLACYLCYWCGWAYSTWITPNAFGLRFAFYGWRLWPGSDITHFIKKIVEMLSNIIPRLKFWKLTLTTHGLHTTDRASSAVMLGLHELEAT